ncbi:MAG: NFYB/HAP3 family transcription factor subunit [Candidatus Marsarchaeota archaeon]|jgi:histone H3/H4|nr:NFYB/HAP3 family transcription factor subunit [Candidatus Marsarchaeota archaeon]
MVARKFSLYDMEQFLREAGAERVTEDAVVGLEKEIERLAEKLADRAMVYAVHAGRKRTIRREDVLLTGRIAAPAMPHQADQRWPVNLRKNARSTNAASSRER